MLTKKVVGAVGLAGSLWIGSVLAMGASDLDLADLRAQFDAGNNTLVYNLTKDNLDAWEGEPEFDFYYGVAAIDTGHVNEGLFALERVLLAQPNNLRARLELARGYFLLREDSRARQEFAAVLAQDPSEQVKANIQRFVDAIRLREGRYRPSSSAYVEFGMGHDTNVSSATDASIVLFNSAFFTSSSSDEPDEFFYVRGGGSYNKPIAPGRSFFTTVDVESRHNTHDDGFDTGYINATAGLSFIEGADQYRISLQGQKYNVGESNFSDFLISDADNTFRQLVGVNGEWRRQINRLTQVSLFTQIADLHYPGADIRDSIQFTVGAGSTHVVGNDEAWVKRFKPVVFGSVWLGHEHADDRSSVAQSLADREFAGLRGGIRIIPAAKVSVDANFTYQWAEYNKPSGIVFTSAGNPVTRRDDFYVASIGVKYLFNQSLVLGGELNYTDNDSRLTLNDFDRTQAKAYVRYNFN